MRFLSKRHRFDFPKLPTPFSCLVLASIIVALPASLDAAETVETVEIMIPDTGALEPGAQIVIAPAIEKFERERDGLHGVSLGQAYGRFGLVLQAWQLSEAARAAFKNAIALDPVYAHWPYYLAFDYERSGMNSEALRFYRQSIRLDAEYPNTQLRIGMVLLASGELQKAQNAFELLLQEHPTMAAPALAGLGETALRRQDNEQAIDYLKRALILQPEALDLHASIAKAYAALGDRKSASMHRQLRGERDVAPVDARIEVMEAHRFQSAYYVRQGMQAAQQGQMGQVVENFMLALAIDPEDADAMARLAIAFRIDDRRDEAERLIDQALDIDPQHGLANSLKGTLLAEKGNTEEAQGYYFRAVSAETSNVEFRRQFANGLMRLGDYDAAALQFSKAISMRPDDIGLHYSLAIAKTMSGSCKDAIEIINSAVEMRPLFTVTLNARARIFSTCPAASQLQREIALADAMQLYEQGADSKYSETVAMALAANGRFEEAIEFQGMAIFEAVKASDQASGDALRANMRLYEAGKPAESAWPVPGS